MASTRILKLVFALTLACPLRKRNSLLKITRLIYIRFEWSGLVAKTIAQEKTKSFNRFDKNN